MKSRTVFLGLAGMTFLALGFGSTTLRAQQITAAAFSADGQGTTIFTNNAPCPNLSCSFNIPTDCACDLTTGSMVGGTAFQAATFVLKDQIYIPSTSSNGTSECISSSGTLVISTASGAVLNLQFAGPACKTPNSNWSLVGGAYTIISGTQRFANAVGTGTLSRSKNVTTNSTVLNLTGNISLNP
jgi:hypothetical protein